MSHLVHAEDEAADQAHQKSKELRWQKAEVLDEIFKELAPRLQVIGIDPLAVCI